MEACRSKALQDRGECLLHLFSCPTVPPHRLRYSVGQVHNEVLHIRHREFCTRYALRLFLNNGRCWRRLQVALMHGHAMAAILRMDMLSATTQDPS
jgi:hypothetical protein